MPISEVYNEDCLKVMGRFPDKFFDLAIVDPPYGINHSIIAAKQSGKQYGKAAAPKADYVLKDWDKQTPVKAYFDDLLRVSKNQIIWGANHFISKIPYDTSCFIVWNKENGANNFADCELAWTSFKSSVRLVSIRWNGMLQYDMKNKEVRIHPTQKPVKLYRWILQHYGKPGDKILDTHLGSQSSRIAAFNMGFDFWGAELDQQYFEMGNKRFYNETKQIQIQFC